MWRTIFFYGATLAVLVFVLKLIEYQYLVRDLTVEFYLGLVALLFTTIGIWAGNRLTRKRLRPTSDEVVFPDENALKHLGISKREHEVLGLMARGCSNQEIADTLFVSLNTVKTHSTNLFLKLGVRRRTQAVQKGRSLRLIP